MRFPKEKRDEARFDPMTDPLVKISESDSSPKYWIPGLIKNVSRHGFSAIFRVDQFIWEEGDLVEISSSTVEFETAQIVWVNLIDETFARAGFEHQES